MSRWAVRVTWGAGILMGAACFLWLAWDPRVPREAFREYSVFNTSATGMSLAWRYLESSGRSVHPLTRPVGRALLPADAVLLRIRPEGEHDPSGGIDEPVLHRTPGRAQNPGEASAYAFTPEEEEWVRGGGRLVLAVDHPYRSITVSTPGAAEVRKVFPLWPETTRIAPHPVRTLAGFSAGEGVSLFAAGEHPILSRSRRGRGEILLCSVPEVFQNRLLGAADHLALLDRLAPPNRPVYFDELGHGIGGEAGTLEILRQWGLGPAIAVAALAALATFWRRRVRVGPEEDDAREVRTEAVDFVDSLALLYRRMLPRPAALRLFAQSFKDAAGAQLGLQGPLLEARVKELLPDRPPGPGPMSEPEFRRSLDGINHAFRRLNDAKRPGSRRPDSAGAGPA